MTKHEISTPALLLDLDAFETNLTRMAERARISGKRLRPHAKAHKCPEIARARSQRVRRAFCVATLSEAELMSREGIPGLLFTSPVGGPCKAARLIRTGAMAVVDHGRQVEWYQDAAYAADRTVNLLIDLDVGDHRTGAASTQQALEIGRADRPFQPSAPDWTSGLLGQRIARRTGPT